VLSYNRFDDVSLCRPLFASYVNKTGKFESNASELFAKVMELAKAKLALKDDPLQVTDMDTHIAMAVRFCHVPLSSGIRAQLVSAHMATLLSVNDPRTHMEAGYEAEPILGEVACHHFCEDRIFMRHLEFLSRMRHSGEIGTLYSQREIGEFCAALLLARAVDKEQLRKAVAVDVEDPLSVAHFGSPLPLRSFLSSFLGEEFASKLKLPPALTRAFVRFVQFVRSEGPITMETLMQAVKHGVALLCKIGEVDVDIIVPLIMLEDGEAPHLRDLQGRHLSMIAIQVKNYHSKPIPVPTMAKILANSFGFAQKILSGIEEDTDEQGHSQEKAPCEEDTGLVSKMEEDISKIAHSEVEPGDIHRHYSDGHRHGDSEILRTAVLQRLFCTMDT